MLQYVMRRLLLAVPTIFGATLLVFVLIRLMPGSALDLMVQDSPKGVSGITVDRLRHRLGLDQPAPVQYVKWLGNLSRGDLGDSFSTGRPIGGELKRFLPVSVELGLMGMVVGLVISVPIGVMAALYRDTPVDYLARGAAVFAISVPSFWIAILVITWPAVWWGWSPPVGYANLWDDPVRNIQVLWVPAIILGVGLTGSLIRFTRTAVLDVAQQDYVRTARAKGLPSSLVVLRHIFRNSLIPIITLVGLQTPILVAGTVVLETVFTIPGMGRYLVTALNQRDYQVLQAVVLVMVTLIVVVNLIVDMCYAIVDPRIRYA